MRRADVLARFDAAPGVVIRPCRAEDLPLLEWSGAFAAHRQVIAEAFEAQRSGRGLMLAAEADGFPFGQVWIRFGPEVSPDAALLWALRVHPAVQRRGLGSRLVGAAERAGAAHGFGFAEIEAEPVNPDVLRLYRRLGYEVRGERRVSYAYAPPGGTEVEACLDLLVLRKPLAGAGGSSPTRR